MRAAKVHPASLYQDDLHPEVSVMENIWLRSDPERVAYARQHTSLAIPFLGPMPWWRCPLSWK